VEVKGRGLGEMSAMALPENINDQVKIMVELQIRA
jgi:hypothetical protein